MKVQCKNCYKYVNINKKDIKTKNAIKSTIATQLSRNVAYVQLQKISYFICPLCKQLNYIKDIDCIENFDKIDIEIIDKLKKRKSLKRLDRIFEKFLDITIFEYYEDFEEDVAQINKILKKKNNFWRELFKL